MQHPGIKTLTIQLPVENRSVQLQLLLICSEPPLNKKNHHAYSILGRINGLMCGEGSVEIVTEYGRSTRLKDVLLIQDNQFIYSNQSNTPLSLHMHVQVNAVLTFNETTPVYFNIKLRYTLKSLIACQLESFYKTKKVNRRIPTLLQ